MNYCSSCGHKQKAIGNVVCDNPKCAKGLNKILPVSESTGAKNVRKTESSSKSKSEPYSPKKTIRRAGSRNSRDNNDDYEDYDDDDGESNANDREGSDTNHVPRIRKIELDCDGISGTKGGASVGGISRKFKLSDLIPQTPPEN